MAQTVSTKEAAIHHRLLLQQPVIQVATPQPRLDSGALVLSELLAQGPFLRNASDLHVDPVFLILFFFA